MLRKFVLKTIKGMIGNEPDYKVREYVLGWLDRGVLTEEDVAEIDAFFEDENEQDVASEVEKDG